MLKIKNAMFGHFPFGGAVGCPVFYIGLDCSNEAPADKEAVERNFTECMDSLKKIIEEKHLEESWMNVLLAKTYLVFSGDEAMVPENRDCFEALFDGISYLSHDAQEGVSVEFRKKPPMFSFVGEPLHNTGRSQWYEHFNLVTILIDPKKENKEPFALLEMMHNSFSTVVAKCDSADDVNALKVNYIKETGFPEMRVIVVTDNDAAKVAALECGYKISANITGSTTVEI